MSQPKPATILVSAGARLLDTVVRKMGLSTRAYDRIRKVARAIADPSGEDATGADHVAEALQYRMVG